MTGELFDQVTYGLELPGTANHLRQLLMTPDVEAQEPAYSVGFSSGIGARYPPGAGQGHFLPPDPVFPPGAGGE
ncbi:MAG: hypothetical protein ACLSUW_00015 [Akkermansia sp.]